MLIGVVGKTNTGKSTFFAASTLVDAKIAPFPFTTIEPNLGKAYVRALCPCKELGVKCAPRNSLCENGTRLIPIDLIDVAGLVPDAHLGKGLGLKFLDDLRTADALIQVIDVSGTTDSEGNPTDFYDPANEIVFLEEEMSYWIAGIIKRSWSRIKGKELDSVTGLLSGLKMTQDEVDRAASHLFLAEEDINWSDDDILAFSREVRKISKPILIAANKIDLPKGEENYNNLKEKFKDKIIVPTCAEAELALRKADKHGSIHYVPGDKDFKILASDMPERQLAALNFIKEKVLKKYGGTGVQELINRATFDLLNLIVVYPVEDEGKFADHFGNALPDAVLLRKGSIAFDLAAKIHTDLAQGFICAVNARTRMRVGKEYVLKNGDVIKVVSSVR
ncbi:MAG: GTP-binding and nucleic acid-binding protein YchF [Candidatus Fermentimicrarchaeum limneticum]|uniref:GTP-binding and nucleic acid-binding protein YchF n=1 Tax=Fermentimicrarchaeum limneticum TaxID=2795018 RepID=A0A7D5XDF7_FERL1|nr:MAG: GTP-binding and nucleic acid-binding protein YchF [Candidatus Fermentimicrarchaeum limneticum]